MPVTRPRQDSNLRPSVPETGALSPELRGLGEGQVSSVEVRHDDPVRALVVNLRLLVAQVSKRYRASRTNVAVAGVAYFTFMALVPMAIAIGSIAGLVLTPEQITSAWKSVEASAPDSLSAITPSIDALVNLVSTASTGSFTATSIVTTAIAIYAASKVVLVMRTSLADVYDVPINESGIVDRGVSALLALVGMTLFVTVLAVLTVIPQVMSQLGLGSMTFLDDAPLVSALIAVAMLYGAIRWVIMAAPGLRAHASFFTWGAALATGWVVVASLGFGLYASWSSSVSAAVVVFGTPIALLLWMYLVAAGVMIGAVVQAVEITTRTSAVAQQPVP